jgi:hypothetical protein
MQDLKPTELTMVVGGKKQTDQITQQLTTLQSSLKDLTSNTANNGSGSNNTFMLLAMMMAMRPQPTVVAAGGPPAVAAAPGPVVNISTRVRHW